MISKKEPQDWLDTVEDDGFVAIDDGGLQLVELDADREETGAYLEVGGTPEEDDEDEEE